MNDVQRQDRKLFIQELARGGRVFSVAFGIALIYLFVRLMLEVLPDRAIQFDVMFGIGAGLVGLMWVLGAKKSAAAKRFHNQRYKALWDGCTDRLSKFNDVLERMRREQVADLQEMPKTIRRVGESLYLALRRADMISFEVAKTERETFAAPPSWQPPSHDAQAKELYRIADKNIAEYRHQYAEVMAGVHRAEAQSAVFMTTLDSLRMKMLGYRLVGKGPELSSMDFLDAMSEAKLQLHAIDQALEELDFTQSPRMIAAVPPPPPAEVRNLEH
jgi:hypothetical protein